MNPDVDIYFEEGCGRCALAATPDCKVHLWPRELGMLRAILLQCGLTEERKWGVPCYTYNGNNVALIGAFKDNCVLSLLKGSLLRDEAGLLQKAGNQSHIARVMRFTSPQQVQEQTDFVKAYLYEAIGVEKANLKVARKPIEEYEIPEELQVKFNLFPAFEEAFRALTPGRQRGYLIHFSSAKQAQTRETRIDRYMPKIMQGKGMMD